MTTHHLMMLNSSVGNENGVKMVFGRHKFWDIQEKRVQATLDLVFCAEVLPYKLV